MSNQPTKKVKVHHGKVTHLFGDPCKFCDEVKREFENQPTLSLCKSCQCMTKKIKGKCGKCNQPTELSEKKTIQVHHGQTTHLIDEPCEFCDEVKREWKPVEELLAAQRELPMGATQWKAHGKKYGYDKYFEEKSITGLSKKELEEVKLPNDFDKLQDLMEEYFEIKKTDHPEAQYYVFYEFIEKFQEIAVSQLKQQILDEVIEADEVPEAESRVDHDICGFRNQLRLELRTKLEKILG